MIERCDHGPLRPGAVPEALRTGTHLPGSRQPKLAGSAAATSPRRDSWNYDANLGDVIVSLLLGAEYQTLRDPAIAARSSYGRRKSNHGNGRRRHPNMALFAETSSSNEEEGQLGGEEVAENPEPQAQQQQVYPSQQHMATDSLLSFMFLYL